MPRSLSNEELAQKLLGPQVDRTLLDEAARRLRECETRHLMSLLDIVTAVSAAPQIDHKTAMTVQGVVMNVAISNRSLGRITSIAGRVLSGGEYTRDDVLTLAAVVLSHDDDD